MQYNRVAKVLYDIKAVQIKTNEKDFFTWTSGIKSPIYCDNRLTMSYPDIRKKIMNAFVDKVKQLPVQPDVIAGCATAGIPHAAWLANELELPMVYVRSKPKGHGKENQVEGMIEKDQKVLVIEDLISTGGSSLEAAQVLQKSGLEVLGVLAIFTYGLQKAETAFQQYHIDFCTLTSFDDLLEMLQDMQYIKQADKERLIHWRDQL